MQRALVTGANGHLGANLVRELLDRGVAVHGLVRSSSNLAGLEGLPLQLRFGDILDEDSVLAAAEGCDVVFHTAAVYRTWARDPEAEIVRPAVQGSANVVRAAARAGARRVVYTSSCNAVGFAEVPDQPRDESMWNERFHVPYIRAKVEAERESERVAAAGGVELVRLLPTAVLGPHDHRITPTTAYVVGLASGKAPLFPSGGVNLVDVRDVALAHVLAAERGEPGGRYLVGGDNVTWARVGELLGELTGLPPKVLGLPRWAVSGVAALMEIGARVSGKAPGLTRAELRDGWGRFAWFDIRRARSLGLEPRGAREVLLTTLDWLRERGEIWAPAATA